MKKAIFILALSSVILLGVAVVYLTHHYFVVGLNPLVGVVFTLIQLMFFAALILGIARWIRTKPPGFFGVADWFAVGCTVWCLVSLIFRFFYPAASPMTFYSHGTFFVVSGSFWSMAIALFFGLISCIYHWFPSISGRLLNKTLGHIHFWITFLGMLVILFPMPHHPVESQPPHYMYFKWNKVDPDGPNLFLEIIFLAVLAVQALFIFNIFYSLFFGKPAVNRTKTSSNPQNQ